MVGLVLTGGSLLAFGTPEQQARAPAADHRRAERVWCQLFSEPEAGSDLGSLTTRAVRDGDASSSTARRCGAAAAAAATGASSWPAPTPTRRSTEGISFFLFDMDLPGVEVRPLRQMTGEAEFDEVFLTDVVLPAEYLLGPLHGGWQVGMAALTNERGHIGSAVIGLERGSTASRRWPSGRRLGAGRARSGSPGCSAGARRTGPGPATGTGGLDRGSLMKLGITELMFDAADAPRRPRRRRAMLDGPAATAMLAAPGGRIAGGTSQVQRTIIGERLLGLPREPQLTESSGAAELGEIASCSDTGSIPSSPWR